MLYSLYTIRYFFVLVHPILLFRQTKYSRQNEILIALIFLYNFFILALQDTLMFYGTHCIRLGEQPSVSTKHPCKPQMPLTKSRPASETNEPTYPFRRGGRIQCS